MQTNLGHPAAIAPTLSLQRNVGQNKHLRIAITSDSSVSNTVSVNVRAATNFSESYDQYVGGKEIY